MREEPDTKTDDIEADQEIAEIAGRLSTSVPASLNLHPDPKIDALLKANISAFQSTNRAREAAVVQINDETDATLLPAQQAWETVFVPAQRLLAEAVAQAQEACKTAIQAAESELFASTEAERNTYEDACKIARERSQTAQNRLNVAQAKVGDQLLRRESLIRRISTESALKLERPSRLDLAPAYRVEETRIKEAECQTYQVAQDQYQLSLQPAEQKRDAVKAAAEASAKQIEAAVRAVFDQATASLKLALDAAKNAAYKIRGEKCALVHQRYDSQEQARKTAWSAYHAAVQSNVGVEAAENALMNLLQAQATAP